MLRKFTLFNLFVVSYIPLFLILSVQNINDNLANDKGLLYSNREIIGNNIVSICLVGIVILSLLYYLLFAWLNKNAGYSNPQKVVGVKGSGVEYLSYLATYIIPFIGLKFDSWNN